MPVPKSFTMVAALALASLADPAAAQDAPAPVRSPETPPKLIVAISVDQFSANLFAEYRTHFSAGFARLLAGAVYPSGYQSHAATETCPGHSTLMTGMRPNHTGIIANNWIDFSSPLKDKTIYCVEDEQHAGNDHHDYTVADDHLMVPTLGDRLKAVSPQSRTVSVSGKDRAAVMMGGHQVDQLWWWDDGKFVSYAGRAAPAVVTRANGAIRSALAEAQPALALPDYCRPKDQAIALGGGKTVGTGRFARAAGDLASFHDSPELDGATLALAAGFVQSMKLGQGTAPDLLTISLSATDYVGHGYGTEGTEMCLQLTSLDRDLGAFFKVLDATGVDYAVVLSADHGGNDLPERERMHGAPGAQRLDQGSSVAAVGKRIAAQLGITGDPLATSDGNVYVTPAVPAAKKPAVIAAAKKAILAWPQVETVFTADEIAAAPDPAGPPEDWSLIARAKASYYPGRSGDLVIALKPRVTPIPDPTHGSVATHGSFWDYDRRVPILFWRAGITGFEQPLSVETVDIAPSLAGLLHLDLAAPTMDGRCLDIDAGTASTCP